MARRTRQQVEALAEAPTATQGEPDEPEAPTAWASSEDAPSDAQEPASVLDLALIARSEAPATMQTPVSMQNGGYHRSDPEAEQPPPAKRYRVERDARLNTSGGIVFLKAGKVVDSQAYSIPLLQSAGIQLTEV